MSNPSTWTYFCQINQSQVLHTHLSCSEASQSSFRHSILGRDVSIFCATLFVRFVCVIDLCNPDVTSSSATHLSVLSVCCSRDFPFPRFPKFLHQHSQVSNQYYHDISPVSLIVVKSSVCLPVHTG